MNTEEELAAYCRRKGIYIDDVKVWREQCLNANTTVSKDPHKMSEVIKEEKLGIWNGQCLTCMLIFSRYSN